MTKLIEITSARTGLRVAINLRNIGEVKDVNQRFGTLTARTLIVHRTNRRVKWEAVEPYEEVMDRIRSSRAWPTPADPADLQTRPDVGPAH